MLLESELGRESLETGGAGVGAGGQDSLGMCPDRGSNP